MEKTDKGLEYLLAPPEYSPSNRQLSEWFQELNGNEILSLLNQYSNHFQVNDLLSENAVAHCERMERAIPYLAEASRHSQPSPPDFNNAVAHLYRTTPASANLRNGWLYWLAVVGESALETWLELVTTDPPQNRSGMIWPFAPYLKNENLTPEQLLSILDAALPSPPCAGVALDLLNFQYRERIKPTHPAQSRVANLVQLLGQVVQQLSMIEEGRLPAGVTPEQLAHKVNDSVALLIALCDMVALCEYRDGEGKLRQATGLKHRRIKVEATAALVRLGFEDARQPLAELAAEPAMRARVIKYAQESNMEELIDSKYRTAEALAECTLANWLAEGHQMGIAPSQIKVIEHRRQFWPGYDNPQDCYLVNFTYGDGPQSYSNIGIVGPMTYVFDFDVSTLTYDDIFSAYAGWQASHDELYEISLPEARRIREREIDGQLKQLQHREFEEVSPKFVAHFFGEWLLVANARHNGNSGTVIVDDSDVHWFIDNGAEASAEFAYLVYRGGRLLRTFNADNAE